MLKNPHPQLRDPDRFPRATRGVLIVLLTCLFTAPFNLTAVEPAKSAETRPAPAVYQFDLAKILFASPAAEVADRPSLLSACDALEHLAAAPLTAPKALEGFALLDSMKRQFRRHDLYLFLRYATDTRMEEELAASSQLRTPVRGAEAAFSAALASLSLDAFQAFARAEPALAVYRSAFDSIHRDATHSLDPAAAEVARLFDEVVSAMDYGRIVSSIEFETVDDGQGRMLDAFRDGNEIYSSADPRVSSEGSKKLFQGFASQRDALALLLTAIIRQENAAARARGFADAGEQAAHERYRTAEAPARLLDEIAARAEFHKRWQALHPRALTTSRSWSVAGLRRDLVEAAAALGPGYRRETEALLDPASGRVDLASGENRLALTGTASVYPVGTSIIYGGAFSGSLYDLIVIAHEAGHAVQAQLMFAAGVPMVYAAGPGFFTESFGRFQELLLLDHLARTEGDATVKEEIRIALEARLLAVFASAEEAAVELRIHEAVTGGAAPSPDELDALTAEAGQRFSDSYRETPERRGLWQLGETYYQAPLHKIDDLYSSLLAVRYFAAWQSDPADFSKKYLALLEGGYDAPPAQLLRARVGIDLDDPGFAAETLRWLEARINAPR